MAKDSPTRNVVSREEAAALGLKIFYSGVKCRNGHLSERHVFDGKCCECKQERYREKEGDPETKENRKKRYVQNRNSILQEAREARKKRRQEADEIEAKHYIPDRPCARGHSLRYVRTGLCVECAAIGRKKWRAENHERTLELQRRWRSDNPERERAGHTKSNRKWYAKSKDKQIPRRKEYYQKNKATLLGKAKIRCQNEEFWRKVKVHKARWRKKNPDKSRQYVHARRARKRGNGGKYTAEDIAEICKMQRGKCAYCPASLKNKYHVDHIVPLARGGSNERRNVQLTCPKCNHSKGPRDPLVHARSLGMLL